MRKKIFQSIITVALVVLLSSIGIATSFLCDYYNTSQINQLKAELQLVADTVNEVGIEYFENFNSSIFRFTVIDRNGDVLYDTQVNPSEMENHAEREEIVESFETGSGSSARNSYTLTEKTFYEAILLDNGNVLRVSMSQLTVGALLLRMMPAICFIVVVAIMVASFLSNAMSKKVMEPLVQLDLDNPSVNDTYKELTPIIQKIHLQHKQIRTQMETLSQKAEEFEQIISSMNEGLILLDDLGMIFSMNEAAKQIFVVKEDAKGIDFFQLDQTSRMTKSVWNALDGKHSEFVEEKYGNEYQFTINPIMSEGKVLGALILAVDITERAFAERNRQEFTANVSHELKTPLQSIIGSAELLEMGIVKEEDKARFVGNIRKEATRLVDLINDIIRLSQLDENKEPVAEKFEIMEVAREVVDVLSSSAAKRKVSLSVEGEACVIYGVRRYIYEIIYNLCDNAIRYNVENGKVTILIGKEDGRAMVSVSDTGIGIPLEHQNRVFERFYRVDKSHSRETGGTGLGLSIVKHAVQYHGGKVAIDSEAGKGTTIKITF